MTPSPLVEARNVRKRFGTHHVLKGIDLDVRRGEVLCLLGPSGSGKSTFLRCINHLEKVDGGRIYVDGELMGYEEHGSHKGRAREMKPKQIAAQRRSIGMVFQRFNRSPTSRPCRTSPRPRSGWPATAGRPPGREAWNCCGGSDSPTMPVPIRPICQEASSKGSPSHARSPWNRS